MKRLLCSLLLSLALVPAGCGSVPTTLFASRLLDGDGNPIVLENVLDIVGDDGLSEEEQREALRHLGIDDEKLIDGLLTLEAT